LESFGDPTEAAFRAIDAAADAAVKAQGITEIYKDIDVSVNGIRLLVRGRVVDGVTQLGTAFGPARVLER